MLLTVIEKNAYQDSVSLMLLTKSLSTLEGISQISVMMGTQANKEIYRNSGLYTEELDDASPNDICIVMDTESRDKIGEVLTFIGDFLKNQSAGARGSKIPVARTWDKALEKLPDADLAVISVAGEYAGEEVDRALDRGMNVFLFSDNVTIGDEKRLKMKARDKGLIVMGPDCGTGILSGVPIAFANVVEKGNIGIVGASGTGIQEVTSIISRLGGGITHAIGIGGRDLSLEIGGISALMSLEVLAGDPETDVVVFISKPPAPEVRTRVVETFKTLGKPVVAIFIGERPQGDHDNIQYAWTLEDTALKALDVSKACMRSGKNLLKKVPEIALIREDPRQRRIQGLYCGGTLAAETAMMIREYYGVADKGHHPDGMMLDHNGHQIIDLGDDVYTRGRPHPMIDPSIRVRMAEEAAEREDTAIILLDNVIGYGGHEDMAGVFAPVIRDARIRAKEKGREVIFIASVTGTEGDPQVYSEQVRKLEDAGAIVRESNAAATRLALDLITYLETDDGAVPELEKDEGTGYGMPGSKGIASLLTGKPRVVNIGLKHFAETIRQHGGKVLQYNWSPVAGGNKRWAAILARLK